MADNTLTVADLDSQTEELTDQILQVSDKLDSLGDGLSNNTDIQNALSQRLDTLSVDVSQRLDGVNDGLGGVRDALAAADAADVDYSTTLQQIGQLMAVTDILLIVLCVMVFLACGLVIGFQITRKLENAG